jgi:hypothetical protein
VVSACPPATGSPSAIWLPRAGAGQLLRECAGAVLRKTWAMASMLEGSRVQRDWVGRVLTSPRISTRTAGDQDREKQRPTGVSRRWL